MDLATTYPVTKDSAQWTPQKKTRTNDFTTIEFATMDSKTMDRAIMNSATMDPQIELCDNGLRYV